jgi:hypothetical protein
MAEVGKANISLPLIIFLSAVSLEEKFIVNLSEDTLAEGTSTIPCTYLP